MKRFSAILAFFMLVTLFPVQGAAVPPTVEDNSGEYIVRLNDDVAGLLSRGGSLQSLDVGEEIYAEEGLYLVTGKDRLDELIGAGIVEYAEPNCEVTLFGEPNDPLYHMQWNLRETGAEDAWDAGFTGEGVRVAVIDSGISRNHTDLSGVNIEQGINLLTGLPDVTDNHGHGTEIAGIISASRNNGEGVAGIMDKAVIIPLKCFDATSTTSSSYIVSAIYRAVDEFRCDVINLSLGLELDLQSIREAVNYAAKSGVIIISAVGNTGKDTLMYPAAYDNVVGVGAFDEYGNVCSFSQKNNSVFVSAPGSNLICLSNTGNSKYSYRKDGTSYSAPHVTGMAVMAKQVSKDTDVFAFMELLKESAHDLGAPGYDTGFGYGAIDFTAFTALLELEEPPIFSDILSHWAREDIEYCALLGVFNGVGAGLFEPELKMTRAMFVTTLYRMEGSPVTASSLFEDVPAGEWYADAVGWAVDCGITNGVSETLFNPGGEISREQMASMLFRYAQYAQRDTSLRADISAYSDAKNVSEWAADAFGWANAHGIITGVTVSTLVPGGTATRAQVSTVLARYIRAA